MRGPEPAFQLGAKRTGIDAHLRRTAWVDVFDGRSPHDIRSGLLTEREVGGKRSWIDRQILGGAELQRVDEDRHHHRLGPCAGLLDQGHVPGVQRAHRRHQPDWVGQPVADARELRSGAHHLHCAPSLFAQALIAAVSCASRPGATTLRCSLTTAPR
jgi:hypothetical protein